MAVEVTMKHPSPIVKARDIHEKDLLWRDIGSGTFAQTFRCMTSLVETSRDGPSSSDVHRRITRNVSTGKVIDDCIVDDERDSELPQPLPAADDIRVELIMKDALAMYEIKHSDVCEIYSQPRVAQEASVKF